MEKNKVQMIQNSNKTIDLNIDIDDIIKVFGSARHLSQEYKQFFNCDLSVTTIKQWIRRKNIKGEHLFCLAYIAKQKNLRFELTDFIKEN
tara:strand:- start:37 stop:306 length:270 start_codon:yes stop_codon:yes gene_type:complete